MKEVSISLSILLCVVLSLAQPSQNVRPAKDSIRVTETQTININQGWSGISSYLDPFDPAIAALMSAIEDQLVIIRDYDGNFYHPSTKSSLINWDFKKGYYIKMVSEETLEITGLYPLTQQLDLQTGWNLIPILCDSIVSVEDYFAENLDEIEIINEVADLDVFWPDMDIFTLTEVVPGKAYLVKANVSFSLFELPDVVTAPATDITPFTAVSGGEVISEGSSSVTERGVIWSTIENPTLSDNEGMTINGAGAGVFVSELTGLLSDTIYYLKAYATNDEGTAYGEEIVFSTPYGVSFECWRVFDYNGHEYNAELIGDQCWMQENLKATMNSAGGSITRYCYDDDPDWCNTYGGLYTWETIMNGEESSNAVPSGVQGICPTGWHVPSDAEWQILVDYLGGALIAGGKLKSTRTQPQDHPRWDFPNIGATNESGFSAMPGGNRFFNNNFYSRGAIAYFFTATEYFNFAKMRAMHYDSGSVAPSNQNKATATSVRCIKD